MSVEAEVSPHTQPTTVSTVSMLLVENMHYPLNLYRYGSNGSRGVLGIGLFYETPPLQWVQSEEGPNKRETEHFCYPQCASARGY